MPYIPRSSAASGRGASAIPKIVKKKHTFRVFGFIASVMIAGAFLSIVGALGYKFFVEGQLSSAKTALEELSESERDLGDRISRIETFNAQLSLAEYLIENHMAPSKLFTLLEKDTKQSVQYTGFGYTYDPGFQVLLNLTAGTNEFNSVALQNNEMKAEEAVFTEYILGGISNTVSVDENASEGSEISEESEHPVTFNFSGDVDTSLIQYTGRELSQAIEESLPTQFGEQNEGNAQPEIESDEDVVEDSNPQELPQ